MDKIGFVFNMSEVMDKYFDLVMESGFSIEIQASARELKEKGYKYVVISGEFTYQMFDMDGQPQLLYWPENVVFFHQELQQEGILGVYWDHRPLQSYNSTQIDRSIVKQDLIDLKKLLTNYLPDVRQFLHKWSSTYQIIFTNEGVKFHQRKINLDIQEKERFEEELDNLMSRLYRC